MYTKRKYGFWLTFRWSSKPFLLAFAYAVAIFAISYYSGLDISIPWQPISIIGIAVAFYLGFKNNSSYDRTWEARKIWGSIVNNSRSLAAAICAFVQGENEDVIKKELIYRHIAWLTALRYQLRLSREWEHNEDRVKGLYSPIVCEQYYENITGELAQFIGPEELARYKSKSNMATQMLAVQSERFQELKDQNYFDDFRHMEFQQLITALYADQGKSERIKNFPFPRQYASAALWVTLVFSLLLPIGMLDIVKESKSIWLWITPFFSALISWVFYLMEMIGDYSENPFEGTYNDVPITSIARGIEIDLREMIDDEQIPKPMEADNGFLL